MRKLQRDFLRLRDGNKCQLCKEPETNLAKGGREGEEEEVILEVHHKDGNYRNNDTKNLMLVCHSCNMREHFKLKGHGKTKSGESVGESVSEGQSENLLSLYPYPSHEMTRSVQIKRGLLKYLFEVAYKRNPIMTEEQILANAPAWIDQQNPPSDPAMRRWLKMFTTSEHYPWRFDEYGILFMVEAEPITKEQ